LARKRVIEITAEAIVVETSAEVLSSAMMTKSIHSDLLPLAAEIAPLEAEQTQAG
jgi:hypothetical protein